MNDAARVATARRWFRALVGTPVIMDGTTRIETPQHVDTWELNFAQPLPGAASAPLLALLDRDARQAPPVVITDALSDPGVEAALALHDYGPRVCVIEMLARGAVRSTKPLPNIDVAPVDTPERWVALEALTRRDLAEGLRTGPFDPAVGAGLIEAMHRRAPPCGYWLISTDGPAIGYGLSVVCPGGLGLIENLFTVPERRGRGIMSAFIVQASQRLREAGCDGIFLDALADAAPKRLYAALGFAPVALSRTWVQDMPIAGPLSPS